MKGWACLFQPAASLNQIPRRLLMGMIGKYEKAAYDSGAVALFFRSTRMGFVFHQNRDYGK
jgi:hypothetical protein